MAIDFRTLPTTSTPTSYATAEPETSVHSAFMVNTTPANEASQAAPTTASIRCDSTLKQLEAAKKMLEYHLTCAEIFKRLQDQSEKEIADSQTGIHKMVNEQCVMEANGEDHGHDGQLLALQVLEFTERDLQAEVECKAFNQRFVKKHETQAANVRVEIRELANKLRALKAASGDRGCDAQALDLRELQLRLAQLAHE